VVDHAEIDRLNHIILELRNRPQEVVHETHEVKVVDHAEIDRLTAIIHELEHRPVEKEVVVET
jgi:MFS superfamily sulfate permease-like transporter